MAKRTIFEYWQLGERWRRLKELCGGLLSKSDEQILRGCLEGVARSAIVEHEYIDKDYRSSYSGFYSKKFSRQSSRTLRLLFFDVPISESDLLAPEGFACRLEKLAKKHRRVKAGGTSPGFIGAVVLRPTEDNRIGRTLLDPRRLASKGNAGGTEACLAPFKVHIMGHELEVMAFPYQSQDSEVHSCAETALWSQFRYLSQRYSVYPEKYPYDIAVLNTDLSFGRILPSRGLTLAQVGTVIGQFGLDAVMYYQDQLRERFRFPEGGGDDWAGCRFEDESDAMHRLLVAYVDSGMPPLVGLPRHAVVAVGLQYQDQPIVLREGPLALASDFVSGILVNDDNYPPYRRIGPESTEELRYGYSDFDSLAVPLPRKVFLTAEEAETVAVDLLKQIGPPIELERLSERRLVRRIVCTSSKNYKAFRQLDVDAVGDQLLRQPLPHFLWLVELYPAALWKKRHAIVEVGIDATAGPFDAAPFLWVRYPEFLIINWRRLYGDGSIDILQSDEATHFPGFSGNLVRIQ